MCKFLCCCCKPIVCMPFICLIAVWLLFVYQYPFVWWFIPNYIYGCEYMPQSLDHKDLNCYYLIRHRIIPFKIEVLAKDPELIQIHQFLHTKNGRLYTERDLNLTRTVLRKSKFLRADVTYFDTAFERFLIKYLVFQNYHQGEVERFETPWTDEFYQYAQMVTGLNFEDSIHEGAFRAQYYLKGGHVFPHHDATVYMPVRFVTMIVTLEAPDSGGATVYPRMGVAVRSKPGDALYVHLTSTDLFRDPKSFHAGCPVHAGRKTLAIFFVSFFNQAFVKKCPLSGEWFTGFGEGV